MGAPIVYAWDDPGAPAWSGTRDGFYEVLKGCLVNGYAGKPAAGWSVVYDEWATSGNASFANAAQSGVLGLYSPADGSYVNVAPAIYVAEAMIDAATPVNGRSGDDAITSTSDIAFTSSIYLHSPGYRHTTAQREWVLIANENSAVFLVSKYSSGYLNVNPPRWGRELDNGVGFLVFGAHATSYGLGSVSSPEVGNFCAMGGWNRVGLYSYYAPDIINSCPSSFGRLPDLSNADISVCNSGFTPFLGGFAGQLSMHDSQLLPVFSWISSGSGATIAGAYQAGRVAGLCGFRDLSKFNSQADADAFHFGGVSFKDVVNIGGKDCIYGLINYTPVAVSLDVSDWL
jgi:hypothetical protein